MRNPQEYDEDDMFKDTRMSFGDHLEELRTHLWRAIWGLLFCMFVGFALDQIGDWLNRPYIGIGKPFMEIIKAPVKEALDEFYKTRMARLSAQAAHNPDDPLNKQQPVKVALSAEDVDKIRGPRPEGGRPSEPVEIVLLVRPFDIYGPVYNAEHAVMPRELSNLSITETFIVYFKVSLVCGLVIASPWVFWQIWSFIAKGLYPHEKKYVHLYLPVSLGLFLTGVISCQIFVMPRSVAALLWFNDFLGITPDLRLNDWLSFAIMLPLLFGLSFQTPLVMLFMDRIGIMDANGFKAKRKYAIFGLAVFAGVITPTPDAITMCCMWIPMCLLYELGIWMTYFMPGRHKEELDYDVPSTDELIEV
jgi:sec-independent protein translocase protein TatC